MPVRVVSLLLLAALTAWVLWRILWAGLPALPLSVPLAAQPIARAAAGGRQVNCPACGKPVAVLKADRCAYCGTAFSAKARQAMATAREAILRDLAAGEDGGRGQGGSVI